MRRRRKPVEVIQADIWRAGIHRCRCVVCGTSRDLDGHHAIPKRVLKRFGFRDHLLDIRNRVPVCRDDHESHENRSQPIPRELLPDSVFEFAAELGLTWYLERHYPAAAAA